MKAEKARNGLFKRLDTVLAVSEEKFEINNKGESMRLSWGRLIVQAVSAYGKLLETVQLDEMVKDIEMIKEKIGMTETGEKIEKLKRHVPIH